MVTLYNKDKNFLQENKAWLWLMCLLYVLSRILVYLAGVRFDSDIMLEDTWQLADTDLLQHKLAQTIWYLNTQPPLFNLFVGLVLKIFPQSYNGILFAVFLVLGAAASFALYYCLRQVGVRNILAVLITVGWFISPACLLFENWFFYDYPIMALLTVAAASVYRFADSKGSFWAHIFFWIIAVIVLTRSMFHPVFMLCMVAGALLFRPEWRKRISFAFVLPVLLVLAWPVKNGLLYGEYSSSSWFGMNLFRIVTIHFPKDLRADLIKKGQLNAATQIYPFSRSERYYAPYLKFPPNPYPEVDLLAKQNKVNGEINFHNYEFRQISSMYKQAALTMIRLKPFGYLKGIAGAVAISFETPSHYMLVTDNLAEIATYDKLYYPLCLNFNKNPKGPFINLPVLFCYIFCLVFLLLRLPRYLRRKAGERAYEPSHALLAFLLFTVAYESAVGVMAEYGENMRFRFQVIPLTLIGIGYVAEQLWRLYEKRKGV